MPTPLRTSLLRKEGRREGLDSSIAPVAPHARSRALHSDCVLFYAAARPCSSEYPTGRFPFAFFALLLLLSTNQERPRGRQSASRCTLKFKGPIHVAADVSNKRSIEPTNQRRAFWGFPAPF